jgi:hypothetical protein
MLKTLLAIITAAAIAAALAVAPADSVADTREHQVVSKQLKTKPPFKARKRVRPTGRSGAGWPEHAAQLKCLTYNGVPEAEGQALRAEIFQNWTTAPDSYSNIVTVRDQYVYFRLWSGVYEPGGMSWSAGNWVRMVNGYPYSAQALVGSRWTDYIYAPTWNLPFAVGTYIGGSSFLRLPARGQSRTYYAEWWWQTRDGAYSAGPHLDALGTSSAC